MEAPPPCLFEAVQRETSNSQILWSARPEAWGYARTKWKTALFGVPFAAFAIFWTSGTIEASAKSNGKVEVSLFTLVGCALIVGALRTLLSPVFALWKARRVFYVVTERSVLIFEDAGVLKIQSFDASGFSGFERISRGDDSGDILFQRNIERRGKGTTVDEVGFFGLRDYVAAEQALRSMMRQSGRAN